MAAATPGRAPLLPDGTMQGSCREEDHDARRRSALVMYMVHCTLYMVWVSIPEQYSPGLHGMVSENNIVDYRREKERYQH
jgi:hypothetical protein